MMNPLCSLQEKAKSARLGSFSTSESPAKVREIEVSPKRKLSTMNLTEEDDLDNSTASPPPEGRHITTHSSQKKLISTNTKMIPNTIQKALKAKTLFDVDIDDCIGKLRTPPPKTFERQMAKMRKVRAAQQKVIETLIGPSTAFLPAMIPQPPSLLHLQPIHETRGERFHSNPNPEIHLDDDNAVESEPRTSEDNHYSSSSQMISSMIVEGIKQEEEPKEMGEKSPFRSESDIGSPVFGDSPCARRFVSMTKIEDIFAMMPQGYLPCGNLAMDDPVEALFASAGDPCMM